MQDESVTGKLKMFRSFVAQEENVNESYLPIFLDSSQPGTARDRNDSLASNIVLGTQKYAFKNFNFYNDGASIASISEDQSMSLRTDRKFANAAQFVVSGNDSGMNSTRFDDRSESIQWNLLA